MRVTFSNSEIERLCIDNSKAKKKYNIVVADKLQQRIQVLLAAESLQWLVTNHVGRCHKLVGDREGQYAMTLDNKKRLVFTQCPEDINCVVIDEIIDYH